GSRRVRPQARPRGRARVRARPAAGRRRAVSHRGAERAGRRRRVRRGTVVRATPRMAAGARGAGRQRDRRDHRHAPRLRQLHADVAGGRGVRRLARRMGVRTRRLTVGQALVEFLIAQRSARDGTTQPVVAGVFGIFGHGNVAGLGEALGAARDRLRFVVPRNEQAMVHTAAAFAKMRNRMQTLACTTSIGPGATNMLTGAAGATINRLPVLLLPGDIFATRRAAPVLQQLESPASLDQSVNDCFKPVSRFWDRINRPEQLGPSLVEAMRVLMSPSETGAVTLALPQDVQAEAFDFPEELFAERTWGVPRPRPDASLVEAAAARLRSSVRPLMVAGGGVLYSEATTALRRFAERTGIAVAETQAGKGALPFDHPQSAGAVGVTGTLTANRLARDADLV